jgi:hypothetical protein
MGWHKLQLEEIRGKKILEAHQSFGYDNNDIIEKILIRQIQWHQ